MPHLRLQVDIPTEATDSSPAPRPIVILPLGSELPPNLAGSDCVVFRSDGRRVMLNAEAGGEARELREGLTIHGIGFRLRYFASTPAANLDPAPVPPPPQPPAPPAQSQPISEPKPAQPTPPPTPPTSTPAVAIPAAPLAQAPPSSTPDRSLSRIRRLPPQGIDSKPPETPRPRVLQVTTASGATATYLLPLESRRPFFIGSRAGVGITIEDSGLRPWHVKMELQGSELWVSEPGNHSTVSINGAPLVWPSILPLNGELRVRGLCIKLTQTDTPSKYTRIESPPSAGRFQRAIRWCSTVLPHPGVIRLPSFGKPEIVLGIGLLVLTAILIAIRLFAD